MKISIYMVAAFATLQGIFIISSASAQNVGIGTNSPAFRLDVQGRMRVKTGTLGNVGTSSGIWFEDYRDGSNRFFLGMRDSIQAGFYSSVLGWDLLYDSKSGNLGLGILNPLYKLSVDGRAGFYDNGNFIGYMGSSGSDFMINAKLGSLLSQTSASHLILQTATGLGSSSGRVGIGTDAPDTKLHIEGGSDVTGASGGVLQLGSTNAANIGIDENEIQARNNGLPAKLFLQSNGEDLQIGGTNHIIINNGYQVYRNRPLSVNADLLPIAYARVGSQGNVLSGTGNIAVTKPGPGEYRLVLLGESNIYQNRLQYVIIVTINGQVVQIPRYSSADIRSDDAIYVQIATPRLNYTNTTINGQTVSYIMGGVFPEATDNDFSIVIYKQ